jgi:hypothetical protein
MRIWSLHPRHLDRQGLLALWREGLLARAVLRGRTDGYRRHPQLERFRNHPRGLEAIDAYLWHVYREAATRGYRFDSRKVQRPRGKLQLIAVGRGQLEHERRHLLAKLKRRDPARYRRMKDSRFDPHPLFRPVTGGAESWERIEGRSRSPRRSGRR